MDNHEDILDALTAFGKNPNPHEIPSVLEQYLNSVAKNGETLFPWTQLKPLILRKMELVITELRRNLASENIPTRPNVENVRFDVIHARIIDSLHKFNGAPFTIQRLCELLIDPKRHYKRSDKFMRGLEKNVLVVSTVDPFGRKVVSELGNKPVLNGILDINGSYPTRDTGLSVPLPPVPGWVNTTAANRNAGTGGMPSAVDSGNKTGINLDTLDKDSDGLVSNSLTVSGTQVFSDQGDPLAVHSEEVVEETVVTMDTGEVSSVVTDGGEALADRDMEGGDMDREDDRDASSSFSSSSSSSSEELSTSSDSIENGLRCSTSPLDMASGNRVHEDVTAMDENRPWAAFAQDIKQQEDLGTTSLSSSSTNQPVIVGDTSGVSSSSPQDNTLSLADPSSSSSLSSSSLPPETQSSLLSASTTTSTSPSKAEGDNPEENPDEAACAPISQLTAASSDQSDWQQQQSSCDNESSSSTADISDQSFGFDPSTPTTSSQHTIDMTTSTTADKLISSSTSTAISTVTTTTTNTTSNNNIKNTSSSSDIHTSSPLTDGAAAVPQLPTYAQVVASSTTDKTSSSSSSIEHISPYSSSTETVPACDSVAGLERLVGSVEQSLSSSSSSSLSSSSSVCPSSTSSSSAPSSSHPSTTISHNTNSSAVTTSSLPECSPAPMDSSLQTTPAPSSSQCFSPEEGEPACKRPRLSLNEESMEEDFISTSGDSCMEQEGDKRDEVRLGQCQEEDGCGSVDSSCVMEGGEQLQQKEVLDQDDVPMEEEGEVTTGSTASVVSGEAEKENGCTIESTSGDSNNFVDGGVDNKVDESVAANGAEGKSDISCTESSDVSTTDGDDNQTTQEVDGTGE